MSFADACENLHMTRDVRYHGNPWYILQYSIIQAQTGIVVFEHVWTQRDQLLRRPALISINWSNTLSNSQGLSCLSSLRLTFCQDLGMLTFFKVFTCRREMLQQLQILCRSRPAVAPWCLEVYAWHKSGYQSQAGSTGKGRNLPWFASSFALVAPGLSDFSSFP